MIRALSLLLGLALVQPVLAGDASARFETVKAEAPPEVLYRLLYALPKGGDLHNHLGGAGFPETWWGLANDPAANGGLEFVTRVRVNDCARACEAPLLYFHTVRESVWEGFTPCCRGEYEPLSELSAERKEAWLSAMRIDEPAEGRDEFFEVLWPRIGDVLNQAPVLAEAAVDNMKRFADEGLRYVEFQISPFGRQLQGEEISPEAFHELLVERLSKPDALATGVTVRFQTNVLRFHPDAEKMVEASWAFVDRHRDWWASVNLVGREDDDKGYPLRFLDVFREMRRRYPRIPLAIHGGEVDEPNRHVRHTLLLGADRIGHGTNLVTDPDTLLLMRAGKFPVEISLVSNHLLEYVSDVGEHAFPEYLRIGIPVCLSTDDRGMWDSNMTDEYFLAVTEFDLSWEEVVGLGRTSLEHAFLPDDVKERLLREYAREVAVFEREHLGDDWHGRAEAVPARVSGYAERHLLP